MTIGKKFHICFFMSHFHCNSEVLGHCWENDNMDVFPWMQFILVQMGS